jgi:2-polyprenyl-3-methyl-5-hydroxy-6-metoxy-1,4-benzoquinol methylase
MDLLSHFTRFRRLEEAAFAFGGRRFGDFAAILDWGCGCGRISRYLAERAGAKLIGCDIDAENVGGCRATSSRTTSSSSGSRRITRFGAPTIMPLTGEFPA